MKAKALRCGAFEYMVMDNGAAAITGYDGDAGRLIIPEKLSGYTVQIIWIGAFRKNNRLTEVTIPDSVTEIRDSAFFGCENLPAVSLGRGLKSIAGMAFAGCRSLEHIDFPPSLEIIWEYAFSGCASLKKLAISAGVRKIAENPFPGCTIEIAQGNSKFAVAGGALIDKEEKRLIGCAWADINPEYTVPAGVETIGESAFDGCDSLVSVSTGDVKIIGKGAFSECERLKTVLLGESVTQIGTGAFGHCPALESVVMPGGIATISDVAFSGSEKVTLIVSEGSPAGAYAKEHGIAYRYRV